MLDTDQLRSFLAIVDSGSFTRAADRVSKTQSAVSMHIRRLEERLGRALFAKHGRGVRLTEDGEKLVDYARRMLQIEAAAVAAVGEKGLAGRIRLGIPDDYAEPFLPEILTRFARRHPLVELSVVCEASLSLAERMHARELDIAIVTDCARLGGVTAVLREEPLRWVRGAATNAHEARPLPLALSGPSCAWRQTALEALDHAGIPWRLALVSGNYAAIAPVVQAGIAVTVLPPSAMRPGQRVVAGDEGLPPLGPCRIGLIESPSERSREALALAEEIRWTLSGGVPVPAEADMPGEPPSARDERRRLPREGAASAA